MIATKEKLITATCVACGEKYWATEDYVCMIKAGRKESLCHLCDPEVKEEGC